MCYFEEEAGAGIVAGGSSAGGSSAGVAGISSMSLGGNEPIEDNLSDTDTDGDNGDCSCQL